MAIGPTGENLIFLISQPRAGSTLLQRILGGHPFVHTVSEPWIMLPALYEMSDHALHREAPYGTATAAIAHRSFVSSLPGGADDYLEGIRRMYVYLYSRALEGSGASRFLDKTPRYYFIIPELQKAFPAASFILLLRNPLAVLDSIGRTWVQGKLWKLAAYRHDLLLAPELLVSGRTLLADRGIVVRYEELIATPEPIVRSLCDRLGLEFRADMLDYRSGPGENWRFGDSTGVRSHARPVAENLDAWATRLEDPQVWRLASDYLAALGRDVLDGLGYDFDGVEARVRARRPTAGRRGTTLPLRALLGDGVGLPLWRRRAIRTALRLKRPFR